jgi:hypothetical protein
MLNKVQVMQILTEGLKAFQEVVDGEVFYGKVPVSARLGNWGSLGGNGCTVCTAGARYLKENRTTIFEAIAQYQKETGVTRMVAMKAIIGDPEILLDSMRVVDLSQGASLKLTGDMTVFGLFRQLGIEVPKVSQKEGYLNPYQVIDRIKGILMMNADKMEEEETEVLSVLP